MDPTNPVEAIHLIEDMLKKAKVRKLTEAQYMLIAGFLAVALSAAYEAGKSDA